MILAQQIRRGVQILSDVFQVMIPGFARQLVGYGHGHANRVEQRQSNDGNGLVEDWKGMERGEGVTRVESNSGPSIDYLLAESYPREM